MKNLLMTLLAATAFNNAGWKMDADGKIELKDGNPIWVDANGGEGVINGDTIRNLNGEAKTLRTRAEAAEAKAKAFEGLDAAAAKEAIDKLSKIDQAKLIDAGKVDEVKAQITAQYTTQLAEKDKALSALQTSYDTERINNLFSGSDFIRERVAMPRDFFEANFRNNFKIEQDGKIAAYDKSGNRVMSEKNIGDFADPNEALELLVNRHPQKDAILKADTGNGTGNGGNGGTRGQGRFMKRSEFDKLDPVKQSEAAGRMGKGELQIVDD